MAIELLCTRPDCPTDDGKPFCKLLREIVIECNENGPSSRAMGRLAWADTAVYKGDEDHARQIIEEMVRMSDAMIKANLYGGRDTMAENHYQRCTALLRCTGRSVTTSIM